MLTLLNYSIVTFIWGWCCKMNILLIDKKILFHRICGFMVFIYSWIHSIGHLTGSFRAISEKPLEEINAYLMTKTFKEKPSYAYLVFCTIPGTTGLILLFIITCMTIFSLKRVWKRCFQVFSLVHFIGTPLFLILIIVHGSDSWFNWGFPLGLLTIPATFLMMGFHYGRLTYDTFFKKFQIADISITEEKDFVMVYILKPKNYNYKSG